MRIQSIAFKWSVEVSLDGILPAFGQVGLHPDTGRRNIWTRSIGAHQLQVEYRPPISSKERSFFWYRWVNSAGIVDPGALDRLLAEWFFTMSQFADTTVNWFQVSIDQFAFQPLHGYTESSPKVWSKEEKGHHFSSSPDERFLLFRSPQPGCEEDDSTSTFLLLAKSAQSITCLVTRGRTIKLLLTWWDKEVIHMPRQTAYSLKREPKEAFPRSRYTFALSLMI